MNDKLIVALDYATEQDAMALVNQLGDAVSYYKVGLELFLNTRGSVVDLIKAQNKNVFLDLKFHDIPNTVAQAVAWAASLGVDMFTLHSSGGEEMMRKSVETVNETCERLNVKRPNMVGVTILTSFDEAGIAKVGYKNNIADTVQPAPQASMSLNFDNTKKIVNIMVFYNDNSFEWFVPKS